MKKIFVVFLCIFCPPALAYVMIKKLIHPDNWTKGDRMVALFVSIFLWPFIIIAAGLQHLHNFGEKLNRKGYWQEKARW